MKTTLLFAALIGAAFAMPTLPATAGDMAATKTGVAAKCFVFPLPPACAAEWNETVGQAVGLEIPLDKV